jgi:hypothetical protein
MIVAMIGVSRRLISNRLRAITCSPTPRPEPRPCARRVDEGDDRDILGQLHQPERLAITSGRHPEVPLEVLLVSRPRWWPITIVSPSVPTRHDRRVLERAIMYSSMKSVKQSRR